MRRPARQVPRRGWRDPRDTYYACLLQYVGCTTDLHTGAAAFGDDFEHLSDHLEPVVYGSARETFGGLVRVIAPGRPPPAKAMALARTLPKAERHRREQFPGDLRGGDDAV